MTIPDRLLVGSPEQLACEAYEALITEGSSPSQNEIDVFLYLMRLASSAENSLEYGKLLKDTIRTTSDARPLALLAHLDTSHVFYKKRFASLQNEMQDLVAKINP